MIYRRPDAGQRSALPAQPPEGRGLLGAGRGWHRRRPAILRQRRLQSLEVIRHQLQQTLAFLDEEIEELKALDEEMQPEEGVEFP